MWNLYRLSTSPPLILFLVVLQVKIDKMFWSKPCSLALAPDSLLRVEEPNYEGIRYFMLKMLLFYSKQSQSIRGANVIYKRVISQVDKPAIYNGKSQPFMSCLRIWWPMWNNLNWWSNLKRYACLDLDRIQFSRSSCIILTLTMSWASAVDIITLKGS